MYAYMNAFIHNKILLLINVAVVVIVCHFDKDFLYVVCREIFSMIIFLFPLPYAMFMKVALEKKMLKMVDRLLWTEQVKNGAQTLALRLINQHTTY